MKHILESSKAFKAYAVIDACYFLIKEAQKKLSEPRSPIETMIDEATGFGKAQTKQIKQDIVGLLEQVIENKKKIDADYSYDEKFLNKIRELNMNKNNKN